MAQFQIGDVFVSISNGQVQQYNQTCGLKDTLDNNTGGFTTGMAFDSLGNLYVTNFNNNKVDVYDTNGVLIGTFGSGYNASPESILFDAAENAYVGQADGSADVLKFDSSGALLASFDVATEDRGSDWIDLDSDQKTLFYTSEGTTVKRYDVSTGTQLADFASGLPGPVAYALRIIPGGGGVLVADSDRVVRLDASGTIVQTYFPPGSGGGIFALNLDPDGTSFWTADFETSNFWKIDIASGNVLQTCNTGTPSGTVFGLAIFGERTAAQCDTCEPLCTDRDIDFTATFTAGVPFTLTEVGTPEFNGNFNFNGDCFTGTCLQTLMFTLCDATLQCCVTLGTVNFSGTADLLISVPALLETDCGSETVSVIGAASIPISQTCFSCDVPLVCPDICDLLDVSDLSAVIVPGSQIEVTGTVTFNCPTV